MRGGRVINASLFRAKHQIWLRILFLSFAAPANDIKSRLYEFSQIEFRHLKWVAGALVEGTIAYDYHRDPSFSIEGESLFELLRTALADIKVLHAAYDDSPLAERMLRDEHYLVETLEGYLSLPSLDLPLSAFNRELVWPDASLTKDQTDALTLFLFEESYKEYELILIYFYQQVRALSHTESSAYQDLIDESHFHLRSFGEMMAKMGILALPRELHPRSYVIEDMEQFFRNGIVEEENAKEECRRLSSTITDPALSSFFEFINHQESYHIEIMKHLLEKQVWKR